MGKHLLLPGVLLSLPLITAWTTFHCMMTEGSRMPLISRYFALCRLASSLSFLASCVAVSNLTQALKAVPPNIEGLCLSGSISVLPPDAFSQFPELKSLVLNLRSIQLLPGALRGLEQLQQISFFGIPTKTDFLYLPPEAFGNLSSLQSLTFSSICLNGSLGVQLPPSLQQLVVHNNCFRNVGMLTDIFPDLVLGSSSEDAQSLDILDLSFKHQLNLSSPGALQGLQLRALHLGNIYTEAAAVAELGLQRLEVLSMVRTEIAELPARLIAHFGLQKLYFRHSRLRRIAPESLASCHSLKSLDLGNNYLTDLPPGFLAAMPRLQILNLTTNQLKIVMLCMNGAGAESGLWVLDLSNNQLKSIHPDTFSCLPHLRELLLQENQLSHLDDQMYQGLKRLETLNLSGNQLAALGENWLASLPALTTLNLLDTYMVLNSTWDFGSLEKLHHLRLKLPSESPRILSLPVGLSSLELHAVSGMKPFKLVPNVFPTLQTLTLKGWGLQLGFQNVSEIFPALYQLSLLGNRLDDLCSQDTSSFFLWKLPGLKQLRVRGNGHSLRPCRITGLPNLQELKLEDLQSRTRPRPVKFEELVGKLPRLEVLKLFRTGLETLSAAAFQGLGSLQVLVLDWENGLVLDSSLQEHSPQMPQYIYFLFASLACQCTNAWIRTWIEQTPRTYVYLTQSQLCQAEARGLSKSSLFPFLQSHCSETLGLALFLGSSALLFLLTFLPFLKDTRNWALYLQTLFRAWFQGVRGQRDERNQFLYDVFVSHCRQDQDWVVRELLPTLEGCPPTGWGLRACLPERDFEPGKDVVDNVADSMMKSQVTLCVLSPQALRTPRCCLELRLATSLLLAAPYPPVLLVVFLEPVSRHQLPRYHRLARLLRQGDYHVWHENDERKDKFWAWLRGRCMCVGG
ncbi:PREDICTED: toll-like receptor 12-like [Chrysochloris asiatica]|uniref:Toll-like receptor 12-like n=1 Tax=Chrysochloris asiatica TaxID=185453 RepID=A0A9B0WPN4_CHRAS|nr:PREDICTED: toll-like receptor 12-like [Chrysochloris asiatica]